METLEALGKRIATTQDLQSIVRTMKSLSAVSIRQYERAALALRQYTHTINLGLQVVLQQRPLVAEPLAADSPLIAVVFGSDHGLCGRFNEQIADFARAKVGRAAAGQTPTRWLAVGLRASARLEAAGATVDECLLLPGAVSGLTATAQRILLTIDSWQADQDSIRITVFHNARTDMAPATPRRAQLLPLDPGWLQALQERPWAGRSLPTFTMEAERLFSALIRQHLFVTLYRAGAESIASEHATRLSAMQAAERNIKDHLEEMNAEYRHRRQQSITEELLDVVAGFESLRATDHTS